MVRSLGEILVDLKVHQAELAKTRDALKSLEAEVGEQAESASDALDSVAYAIAELSQAVDEISTRV